MHRLLVLTEELSKDEPMLPKEARDHLKVLRPKDGEPIELFDGKGSWRVYTWGRGVLTASQQNAVTLAPRPRPLVLFACVTKGSRWDWTIEKATELGATRIVPVISERTIIRIGADEREAKRARWTRIAEDAARQSDAKWIPEVLAPVSFADSLALVRETTCFVGALTTPPPKTIGEVLSSLPHSSFLIPHSTFHIPHSSFLIPHSLYVGPEGDFTPDELAALLAIATPVSFGSTILRAETAAIYGLSVLKAFQDQFTKGND